MSSDVDKQVLKSELPAFVELFELDLSTIDKGQFTELSGSILRVTPMSETSNPSLYTNVIFEGHSFIPFPVKISGISQSSEGAPARPQLQIANVDKTIGNAVFTYNDIIGATLRYIRTFNIYLGTTVPGISLPPLQYYISKKLTHDKLTIAFELRDYRDKERMMMPRNQMLKRDYPGLGINKDGS